MSEPAIRTPESSAGRKLGDDPETATLGELVSTLGAIVSDLVRLIAVDARLCGRTVLAMIGLTVIAALLLVGGWLLVATAAVLLLSELEGVSPAAAFLAVGGVHMAMAGITVWWLRSLARDLTFRQSRATLRSFVSTPTADTTTCSDARD